MNACESAFIDSSGDSTANLASTLINYGIDAVVGTSFKAMDSTMDLFYNIFFTEILAHASSFRQAVVAARDALSRKDGNIGRKAVFGRTVHLQDHITPVVYVQPFEDTRASTLAPLEVRELIKGSGTIVNWKEPFLMGRIRDILQVESLLTVCPILLIHGQGGAGKSAVVRHLEWWWQATGFVKKAIHVDLQIFDNRVTNSSLLKEIQRTIEDTRLKDSNSLLLVVDGIEQWARRIALHGDDPEGQKRVKEDYRAIREFFEEQVSKNDEDSPQHNTYVVLTSRVFDAFDWDLSSDIVSHQVSGLSIVHGLELGLQKARPLLSARNLALLQDKPLNSEERDNLEKVIEVLDGNPLAIELAFEGFARTEQPITRMLENVLAGHIPIEIDFGKFKADRPGPRFAIESDNLIRLWVMDQNHPQRGIVQPQNILGLFNLTIPNYRTIFVYLFRRALSSEGERSKFADMDGLFRNPAQIEMISQAFDEIGIAGLLKSLLDKGEKEGWIVPYKTEKFTDDPSDFYYIHPVVTLMLRSKLNTPSALFKQARTTFVQHRIFWDCMCAKHTTQAFPRHEWSDTIKRSFEAYGKWNMVAAVIHAQKLVEDTPITDGPLPWAMRLLIPIAPNLSDFAELVGLLRPYLMKELQRHLSSTEIHKNENCLYSAIKLAYYLRFTGRVDVWDAIYKVHQIAEQYIAEGRALSNPSQLALMETRSVDVARHVSGQHDAYAVELLERNLRFEPKVSPGYPDLPAMKRAITKDLLLWAAITVKIQKEKAEAERTSNDLTDVGKKLESPKNSENTTGDRNFADNLISTLAKSATKDAASIDKIINNEPMRDFFFFKKADKEKMESFSTFTKAVLDAPLKDSILDLVPDDASLVAHFKNNKKNYLEDRTINVEVADMQMRAGNTEKAKETLHDTLAKQLRETNDAPTNYYIHTALAKIAEEDRKWETAREHYLAMIALGTEGTCSYTWISICKCDNELNDIEALREHAIKAVDEAYEYQKKAETEKDRMLLDTFKTLTKLDFNHIKDLSCIQPKRRALNDADASLDDKINPVIMYKRLLYIVNKPEYYDVYDHDGVLFCLLWDSARTFVQQFKTTESPDPSDLVLPTYLSQELRVLLHGIVFLDYELSRLPRSPGVGPQDIGKEVEDLVFKPTEANPQILTRTLWAEHFAPTFLKEY